MLIVRQRLRQHRMCQRPPPGMVRSHQPSSPSSGTPRMYSTLLHLCRRRNAGGQLHFSSVGPATSISDSQYHCPDFAAHRMSTSPRFPVHCPSIHSSAHSPYTKAQDTKRQRIIVQLRCRARGWCQAACTPKPHLCWLTASSCKRPQTPGNLHHSARLETSVLPHIMQPAARCSR